MRVHLLLLLLLAATNWLTVADPSGPQMATPEIQECCRNLHMIYQAIQAYRHVYQDLPNSLADLQPQFLSDTQHLICPTARRLGLTSADLVDWGASLPSTYEYDFEPRPIPHVISGGSQHSMREWKRLQLGLLGSDVAMVRCHTHEELILNLSFGGRIYQTEELDWEQSFRDIIDPLDLSPGRCLAAYLIPKTVVLPRRPLNTTPNLIDLSDYYNRSLDEIWPEAEGSQPLSQVPSGIHEFAGTHFDVRGAIQLRAMRPGLVPYPDRVNDIPIGMQAHAVHCLVATVASAAQQTIVGTLVFHLADGRQEKRPLQYGRDLRVYIMPPQTAAGSGKAFPAAWSVRTSSGQSVTLYVCDWNNPWPTQAVRSVDFVSGIGNAGPLLLAMSLEDDR